MKPIIALLVALLVSTTALAESETTFRPVSGGVYRLSYGATTNPLTSFMGSFTNVVRLVCTTDCFVAFAVTPVATQGTDMNSTFLPANTPEYFSVDPGEKIAVIRLSSDGFVYVTEMTR